MCIALYFGDSIYKTYVEEKSNEKKYELEEKRLTIEDKRLENDHQERIKMLDMIQPAQEKDRERLKLTEELSSKNEDIALLKKSSEEHYRKRLEFTSKTDSVKSNGLDITGTVAKILLEKPTNYEVKVKLNGTYKVEKANHKPEKYHTFTITNVDTGECITSVKLTDMLAASDIGSKINDAAIKKNSYRAKG